MCAGSASAALRTLGLNRARATPEEVKQAFRQLAKKWHPDRHQGASKANAEARFKEIQSAHQLLSMPGKLREAVYGDQATRQAPGYTSTSAGKRWSGAATGASSAGGGPHVKQQQWWGEAYGEAGKPGYNPYGGGYMGFKDASGKHWYEDTAQAAADEDRARMFRSWLGAAIFGAGFYAVTWTSSRDRAAKERGELVDAWWNQNTRRWEKPLPHMFKDPLLSSLIHLKPPAIVHDATSKRPQSRKQSVTIGSKNFYK